MDELGITIYLVTSSKDEVLYPIIIPAYTYGTFISTNPSFVRNVSPRHAGVLLGMTILHHSPPPREAGDVGLVVMSSHVVLAMPCQVPSRAPA
jgi:hypothetical protein